MYMDSERSYFDYATDTTLRLQKEVKSCREWKNECKDLTHMQIIKKYLAMVSSLEQNYSKDKGNGMNYVISLVKDIFATIIEEDKGINNTTIDILFNEYEDHNSEKIAELKSFCRTVVDTKRMKKNHEIISKRYNIQDIFAKTYLNGERRKSFFIIPFIFSLCRKLDTYNLELPDKINLMCEEIAFILDHHFKYAVTDNEDRRYILEQVVPGVMTYILGTYSAEDIPEDVIDKVIEAAAKKVSNSSFFKGNCIDLFNIRYFYSILGNHDKIENNKYDAAFYMNSFFYNLAKAQKDGSINTKQGLIDVTFKTCKSLGELDNVYNYIIYFYGIFSPDGFSKHNISVRKIINAAIDDYLKSNNYAIDHILFILNQVLKKTIAFADNIKPSVYLHKEELGDLRDRYVTISSDIDKLSLDIKDKIFYFESRKKAVEDKSKKKSVDIHDDTGLPLTLSNYEKKILASSEFMIDRLNESVEDQKNFIDIITEKSILVHTEALDFLSKAIDECPTYFNLDKLKTALQESYASISEDQSADFTSERCIAMGTISNIISKINQYNKNMEAVSEVIDESCEFNDYIMNDIDNTIEDIVKRNIDTYTISETVHSVTSIPVHEMKISSYARMVLDKFRQGYEYLDDKQKALFDTLDRMADRFSHFDDREARAEARMQVIKGQMLPSLSKCLKTLLMAGLLAIINPWLGLLTIVIKYVTSKNATKEERQAVCDELEVEIQMIDRKINDAVEEKNYKLERKLRLLKKKMLVQYSKISYDNMVKWDNSLYMKSQTDETGQKIGLKDY